MKEYLFRIGLFKPLLLIALTLFLSSCESKKESDLVEKIMASMGSEVKSGFEEMADDFRSRILADSTSLEALLGLAETQITIYIFGFSSREETIPEARKAFNQAWRLDSMNSGVRKLEGMLSFLDWA